MENTMHSLGNASISGAGEAAPATALLSRTDRLMGRVVEHLATLQPCERVPWLRRQLAVWIRQYERWAETIDSGQATAISDVTVEDYLDTISRLNRLIHACEPAPHEVPANA